MARCQKRRYRDKVAAELALAILRRKDKEGHDERRAYQCRHCRGAWHLTSQEKRCTDAIPVEHTLGSLPDQCDTCKVDVDGPD